MIKRLVVPTALTAAVLAALTGCFGDTSEQSPEVNGSQSPRETASSPRGSSTPEGSSATGSTATAAEKTAVCQVDAGCEGPPRILSARVTLDGRNCPVDISYPASALDMGLNYNGWTAAFTSNECGIILNVSGLDDAPYPQTSATAILGESRVMLFTGESPDGTDGGASGAYSNAPDGTVTVASGPQSGIQSTIAGSAHVTSGARSHDLTFEMVF